ncbi:TBC1 domain family member 13 [Aphelenchoides bicaudatus]|nr:TBC1 domain family member 13 [Aphelenchoides bicaudatus]
MTTSARQLERITKIESLLLIQNLVIDTALLREECEFGVPDSLRPLCWRLFLNYLPKERQEWQKILSQRRKEYSVLVENLISNSIVNEEEELETSETNDHPLSDEKHSQWCRFFKDKETFIQIHKDVKRLRPEIDFFQRYTPFPSQAKGASIFTKCINACDSDDSNTQKSKNKGIVLLDTNQDDSGNEFHWQVVERILFVYSKVNPGICYVQGMNEILAPLYYAFASDSDVEWSRYAEADYNFIKSLDTSNCGIESTLTNFQQKLEFVDPELYMHLIEKLEIKPQFFAFRWLSLLLAQEFSLPDVIALWDTVFASSNRIETTELICLAMMEHVRNELLASDFPNCVRLLQNYPSAVDVSILVNNAFEIKLGLFESQRSGSTSKQSGRFWKNDRLSTFMSTAKNQLSNYAQSARRFYAKSDGSITYRP